MNKFEYNIAFDFLVGNTTLISGSPFQNNKDVDENQTVCPLGNE